MSPMHIRQVKKEDRSEWLRMRQQLYEDCQLSQLVTELDGREDAQDDNQRSRSSLTENGDGRTGIPPKITPTIPERR